jgi:hypothetical protein
MKNTGPNSTQASMAGLVAPMNHFQYLAPNVLQMNFIANFRHIACLRNRQAVKKLPFYIKFPA